MVVRIAIITAEIVQAIGLLLGREDGMAMAGAIIAIGAFIQNRLGGIGRPREALGS